MRFIIYDYEKETLRRYPTYLAKDINDGLWYMAFRSKMLSELQYTDAASETRKKKHRDAIKHGIYKCLEGRLKSYLGCEFKKVDFQPKKLEERNEKV